MALEGSTDILEQARMIVQSYSNNKSVHADAGDLAIVTNGKLDNHGRRPALGRKRAQFSLKPIPSLSTQNVDFSSIDCIKDPEEYFWAVEKLESNHLTNMESALCFACASNNKESSEFFLFVLKLDAEKELKRLRGEASTDLEQNSQTTTTRQQRPGILRKKVSYRYDYTAEVDSFRVRGVSQDESLDGKASSSSEALTSIISTDNIRAKDIDRPGSSVNDNLLDATERKDSVTEREKDVNGILDNLLSSFKDLDEDEGAALLRESLQIKSINVGKVRLPDLPNIGSLHTKAMRRSPKIPISSTNAARSALAAISTLQKRISPKDPRADLYTMSLNPDEAYCNDSSPSIIGQSKQSPSHPRGRGSRVLTSGDASTSIMVNGEKSSLLGTLSVPLSQADRVINKVTTEEKLTSSLCTPQHSTEHSYKEADNDKSISTELGGRIDKQVNDMKLDALVADHPTREVEEPSFSYMNIDGTESLSSPGGENGVPVKVTGETTTNDSEHGTEGASREKVNVTEQEPVANDEASKDYSSHQVTVHQMDARSDNPPIVSDENNEVGTSIS
uniref:Uncharacterized protein n=1 Tax=Ananas comosus var. bracteatus TaxID=296719 RepID=A0A6V7PQ86_ANACO|nr:unnamed protein product [Ananas comosus var. bracteatus]